MDEILRMIENVDPNNESKIWEINARVWCFINNQGYCYRKKMHGYIKDGQHKWINHIPDYCNSRDALKAIRPDWACFEIHANGSLKDHACYWEHWDIPKSELSGSAENLPSEELAELHAIIQCIAHERQETKDA